MIRVSLIKRPKPPRDGVGARQRFRVLVRDDYRCRYCGRGAPQVVVHVDHVVPVAKGGQTVDDNLVCACFDCNTGKSAAQLPGPVPPSRTKPEPFVTHYDPTKAATWLRAHGWDVGPKRARIGTYSIPSPLDETWNDSRYGYPLHDIACYENLGSTEMARRMTIDLKSPPNPYR